MSEVATWSKERGYIWSMIGSAVGFANVLSFSALCYKNGGGAFLIPYILAHVLVGIPLLFLEAHLGQKTKLPFVSAIGRYFGGIGKTLGWLAICTCATIGGFYMVLTGFAVAYTYFSASGFLPTSETALFFKQTFLQDSGSLTTWGGISVAVCVSTIVVAAITWFVLARNIQKGVERLCSLFLPMLAIIVLFFTLLVVFLPGFQIGLKHYLIPDFSRLYDITLWRDVFGQVFFSLSLGLGIVTGYSRHNPDTFSIPRAMIKVAIGDFIISFTCGLAIFGCIGFASLKSGISFTSLIQSDSAFEIGFIIFPMILAQFGNVVAHIVGPLFFFCIFIAGITGVFSIVESVAGNIQVEFGQSRKKAVAIAMVLISVLALPFCMGNGQHVLGALAPMVLGDAMLLGGIIEIVFFLILSKAIKDDAIWIKGGRRTYPFYALKYLVLPLLIFSLVGSLYQEVHSFEMRPDVTLRLCWLIATMTISIFLARKKLPQYGTADFAFADKM